VANARSGTCERHRRFIFDAKNFYASHDAAGAALGTALDHLNRADDDGLRRIKSDAERGKRANAVAGTREHWQICA
jgi:hypothetical protein